MRSPTIAEATAEVMLEQGETRIWLGNVDLWEGAYSRRFGFGAGVRLHDNHPMNRARAVFTALRRSPLFRHAGYIREPGEVGHPVFDLA